MGYPVPRQCISDPIIKPKPGGQYARRVHHQNPSSIEPVPAFRILFSSKLHHLTHVHDGFLHGSASALPLTVVSTSIQLHILRKGGKGKGQLNLGLLQNHCLRSISGEDPFSPPFAALMTVPGEFLSFLGWL